MMHPGVRLLRITAALASGLSVTVLATIAFYASLAQGGNLWVFGIVMVAALWTVTTALLWAVTPVLPVPLPILMTCPRCDVPHVDEGAWVTHLHRTHQCAICGHKWRPAAVCTVGVIALP